MPVPKLPLTPQSSVDIAGQDKPCSPAGEGPLQLPPPAVRTSKPPRRAAAAATGASAAALASGSSSSNRAKELGPILSNDTTANRKRRRLSMANASPTTPTTGAISLPPPPTRSCTIIQMQPGASKSGKGNSGRRAVKTEDGGDEGEKGTTATAAAGKTSARSKRQTRKTAHSVIERRRRSKMNEELETMKEMIPACKGQTMHKLAILQAGVDYLRYLEQCVADLTAANRGQVSPSMQPAHGAPPANRRRGGADAMDEDDDDDEDGEEDDEDEYDEGDDDDDEQRNAAPRGRRVDDEDEDDAIMRDDDADETGTATPRTDPGERPPTGDSRRSDASLLRARFSHSSASSARPSPLLTGLDRGVHSADASPALPPHGGASGADYEATAALLMLNGDRAPPSAKGLRGLSVQDLLSG